MSCTYWLDLISVDTTVAACGAGNGHPLSLSNRTSFTSLTWHVLGSKFLLKREKGSIYLLPSLDITTACVGIGNYNELIFYMFYILHVSHAWDIANKFEKFRETYGHNCQMTIELKGRAIESRTRSKNHEIKKQDRVGKMKAMTWHLPS